MALIIKLQEIQNEFNDIYRSFLLAKSEVLESHTDVCKTHSTSAARISAVSKYEARLLTFKVLHEKLNKKGDEFEKATQDIAKAAAKGKNRMQRILDEIDDLEIPTVANGQQKRKSLMKRPPTYSSPAQQPPSKKAATALLNVGPESKAEAEDGFNDEWPEPAAESKLVANVALEKEGKKEEPPAENATEPSESKLVANVDAEKEEKKEESPAENAI